MSKEGKGQGFQTLRKPCQPNLTARLGQIDPGGDTPDHRPGQQTEQAASCQHGERDKQALRGVEVGQEVPPQFYGAVAEILALDEVEQAWVAKLPPAGEMPPWLAG